jgi:hypothetical protein
MTKERLIELAKQAGWEYADGDRGFEPLWDFAELVRADEREACAKVCDAVHSEYEGEEVSASWIAAAIRNRGNT